MNQRVEALAAELTRPGKIIEAHRIALKVNIQRLDVIALRRPARAATVNTPAYACPGAAD